LSGPSSHSTRGRKRTLVSFRFGLRPAIDYGPTRGWFDVALKRRIAELHEVPGYVAQDGDTNR
jgi:hypothetical protein